MKKTALLILCMLTSTLLLAQTKTTENSVMIQMETTAGTMVLQLYNETPKHRDNFIKLANEGYYDGLLFHRVIKAFMIQGGDPDSKTATKGQQLGQGGPGYTVEAEINPAIFHIKGSLAAARMGDAVNPEKASSGSQFYIVQGRIFNDNELNSIEMRNGMKYSAETRELYKTVGGTPHLDGAYTVFGKVVEGLEVIDAIAASPTAPGDRPLEDVKIIAVKVLK